MYCKKASVSVIRPHMDIVINKRCVISFECNNNWEIIYNGDRIIIRQVQEAKYPEVELKDGDIYDKIFQLLRLRHMSIKQLATTLNMPYTTLASRMQRRSKKISDSLIEAIAMALDVDSNELKEAQHHET